MSHSIIGGYHTEHRFVPFHLNEADDKVAVFSVYRISPRMKFVQRKYTFSVANFRGCFPTRTLPRDIRIRDQQRKMFDIVGTVYHLAI
jgi:hypothetical protein